MKRDSSADANKNRSFHKAYTHFEDIFSYYLPGVITLFMMVFLGMDIVLRCFFNSTVQGIVEVIEAGMVVITFASLPAIQREKGHVRMDLIIDKLQGKRVGHVFEMLNYIIPFIMFAVFGFYLSRYCMNLYSFNESSSYLHIPLWPVGIFMPLGALFLCIRFLYQIREESRKITQTTPSGKE